MMSSKHTLIVRAEKPFAHESQGFPLRAALTTLRDAAYNALVSAPSVSRAKRPSVAALTALPNGQELTLTVRGDSMLPALEDGDRVRVTRSKMAWPGDIVLVPIGDRLVMHRMLGLRLVGGKLAMVTRGDATSKHDPATPVADVIGVLTRKATTGRSVAPSLRVRLAAVREFAKIGLRRLARP